MDTIAIKLPCYHKISRVGVTQEVNAGNDSTTSSRYRRAYWSTRGKAFRLAVPMRTAEIKCTTIVL